MNNAPETGIQPASPVRETGPVLRTLSPALRGLERNLRAWLDTPRRFPLSAIQRGTLEGVATDLKRQADALDVDRPLLIVMLMGGTGVGKSTLLNALAGGSIAPASFTRPTTRDPVVYYHESVRPDRLDPALRHCRLVAHDRAELAQKVLVDTPDVDSNDLTNRDKLLRVLPVADVVLYVGSQEKYHDQIVWDIFHQQHRRRAFAFILNKWDRCLHAGAAGLRPDEDLLRDLHAEGFQHPVLFRTCAQIHLDRATGAEGIAPLPEGEQFDDLLHWLEMGLSRLEIEAIKARGAGQLLECGQQALAEAAPPDLGEIVPRVRAAWAKPIAEEAETTADILVNTLEPMQREIEHHFAIEGHRRFRGLMGWYLQTVTRARYVGSSLRSRIPFVGGGGTKEPPPSTWSLSLFTSATADVAANRQLDARVQALVNRLLVDADAQGYPLAVLTDPVEALARLDWRKKWSRSLTEVLADVERQWTRPTGSRQTMQETLVFLGDWVPPLALLAALATLLWRFFDPYDTGGNHQSITWHLLMPFVVLLAVLIALHLLIHLLLPLRWKAIREAFHKKLEERVRQELEQVYLEVPGDLATRLREERKQVEKLIADHREVAAWLHRREQSASIADLYGTA